ncbi:hypothetical protein [Nocardioides jishulii]|uniref:Uncharacterized protein n=1 Tax=Nocardioides jishulii TaxID=2575440 RepID=A0A4U2YL18_9ACTN|nr:hypothetical protein [Nocardioides jishulii]QCX26992.1 hypothetical protein FCL41_05200 [Nocardioides jishulii]TKI61474.1 hypothetical protein FC770_11835 [Nocardioides jishulii]
MTTEEPEETGDERVDQPERWFLSEGGHDHVVEVSDAGIRKRVVWRRGGKTVAVALTADDKAHLSAGSFPDDVPEWDADRERLAALPEEEREALGAVSLRLPALVGPTRRVTWHSEPANAALGVGGIDLAPEEGSRAAARQDWIRRHPHLHALRAGLTKGGGIVASLLAILVLTRWVLPWLSRLVPDWDLPSIRWPDWNLPSIPWPDISLPSIPWPDWDLPDLSLPPWVALLVKYGVPVLFAVLLAVNEARRHRKQEEQRRATRPATDARRASVPEADGPRDTDRDESRTPTHDPSPGSTGTD